jgi:hypothetical protein
MNFTIRTGRHGHHFLSRVVLATVSLTALLLLTLVPSHVSRAATLASVTVSSQAAGTLETQMSTNNVWSGMIDQAPGAQALLNALHAPLVRLHVGDDGWPEAMPEITQGSWDMSALDALVTDIFKTGQQPLMNIKFAPDWMWTCYPNSIGISGTQGTGTVADLTFAPFATYMARLVSYYNKGSMTTESGTVITNPYGTSHRVTYWELWNEPDLNIETPCAPSNGYGITPAQYVTMWNAATAAMLAVDPTLKFVGPATAGSQFGSSTTTGNQYVDDLMTSASVKPAALSFHGYGSWDNSVTDQTIFDGDNSDPANHCCGGITDIVGGVKALHTYYPTLPIWLTEVNVNAAWGNDPYQRPWTAFGAAWWGALFQQVAPLGVAMIHEYDVIDAPQFGLMSDQSGAPYLPYWEQMALNAAFPPGSTLLSSSSSAAGILALAASRPDGKTSILVVNRQVNSSTTTGGTGLAATVTVNLPSAPSALSLQQIDATTSAATGPVAVSLPVSVSPQLTFGGYGMAILTVSPGGSGGSTPTPTATATTPATSTPGATSTATVAPTATTTAAPTATSGPTSTATAASTATPTAASATPTPSGSSSSLALYTNGKVAAGFFDWSFGYSAKDPCDTSVYYSPPCSYAITYTQWGGLDFVVAAGTMATSGYASLQYKLDTNGQPVSDFGALFTDSSGAPINEVALESSMVTPLSGGWVQVSIPIAQLNPANLPVSEIQLKNELDTSLTTVHYADVYLVGTASPTATPTPINTPTSTATPRLVATPTSTAVAPTPTPTLFFCFILPCH